MAVKAQKKQVLFSDFQIHSKNEWIEKAIKDLKGEDSFQKLIWKTEDGFEVFPFYTKEDLEGIEHLESFHHLLLNSENPAVEARHWDYLDQIEVENEKTANETAINVLNNGADGILFLIKQNNHLLDLNKILKDIFINYCTLIIKTESFDNILFIKYLDYLKAQTDAPEQINGGLFFDPINKFARSANFDYRIEDHLALLKKAYEFPSLKVVAIDAEIYHNSGGTISQELGCILSTLVYYLDNFTDSGIEAQNVLNRLSISVAIGTNFFQELAKLKALRILIYKIAEAYGLKEFDPATVSIHCTASAWNRTTLDPHTNILRHTTEAMSAILGGANSLSLAPFDIDSKSPGAFSKRISRNIPAILKEESYFNKVADPAAGAYFIENMINNFVNAGWDQFLLLEDKGGIKNALEIGFLQNEIEKSRLQKLKRIAERKTSIIGTNKYPHTEKITLKDVLKNEKKEENFKTLKEHKASQQFDSLRYSIQNLAQQNSEKFPEPFIVKIGDPLMQKLRAEFTVDFFACAGIRIKEQGIFKDINEAAESAALSKAQIIILCGADEDYALSAVDFAKKLKNKAKDKLIVLAGYPKDIIEELNSAGFDEFIYSGCNAIDTLNRIYEIRYQV